MLVVAYASGLLLPVTAAAFCCLLHEEELLLELEWNWKVLRFRLQWKNVRKLIKTNVKMQDPSYIWWRFMLPGIVITHPQSADFPDHIEWDRQIRYTLLGVPSFTRF